MLPSRHFIVSASLGAGIGLVTRSPLAAVLCLCAGTLGDADHVIEYIIHYGFNGFTPKNIYQTCRDLLEPKNRVNKLYLVFHGIEYSLLLWAAFLLTRHIYIFSIAVGYTGHLILDIATKQLKPWSYFITARMKKAL